MTEILNTMVLTDNTSKLTATLDRKEYVEINELLETLGGVWSRKNKCHEWNCNPKDKIDVYINGGDTKTITTNLETKHEKKKKFQYFPTPPELCDFIIEYYALIQPTDKILEPSAGGGNFIKSIQKYNPTMTVDCYELQPDLNKELTLLPNVTVLGTDFLAATPVPIYDKIYMNPPFAKHQDLEHIQHAYKFLKPGGRLVSIISKSSWSYSTFKKPTAFREWLNTICGESFDYSLFTKPIVYGSALPDYVKPPEKPAPTTFREWWKTLGSCDWKLAFKEWFNTLSCELYPIKEGSFKGSGTMVSSQLLVIDKK